jgi:serine/threonine protein kinase
VKEAPTELSDQQPKDLPTVARRVLKHRFELLETLGEGGMGVVYKALDYQRRKSKDPVVHVALKVISEAIQKHTDAVLALQREFSRTLQLTHPNIVRTYDFDTDDAQNVSFLTMELLEGESLDAILKRYPKGLPAEEYVPLLKQLLDGLGCAHQHGIVHSDLKPSNIFVVRNKQLKIMDFGIAAPLRPLDDPRPGTLFDPRKLGALSPSHACLEMFAGMAADPRDDIYSLGCLVYQLTSGHHPFHGARAPRALEEKMSVGSVATLSEPANQALRDALQFHRADRIGSVDEFRRRFFESEPVQVASKGSSRTWRWAIPVGAGMVLAAALGVTAWQMNRPASKPPLSQQPASEPTVTQQPLTEPELNQQPARPSASESRSSQASVESPKSLVQAPASAIAAVRPASNALQTLVTDDAAFKQYCGERPSRALLDALLQQGLEAQVRLSLASTDAMRIEESDKLTRSAKCIRAMDAREISTEESRTLLRDAEALLRRSASQ